MSHSIITHTLIALFIAGAFTCCQSETPVTPKEQHTEVNKPAGDDRYGLRIIELTPYVSAGDSAVENWLIMNFATDTVSLTGWKVVDPEPSRSYTWEMDVLGTLPPKDTVRFKSSARAQLNNNGDDLVLISPTGDTVQRITFGKVAMGEIVKPM